MKQTINPKGRPGMFIVGGRPDRTKAPLVKPEPQAVTLTPLDPTKAYPQSQPQEDEIKPSGTVTTNSYRNEVIVEPVAGKTKKKWSS